MVASAVAIDPHESVRGNVQFPGHSVQAQLRLRGDAPHDRLLPIDSLLPRGAMEGQRPEVQEDALGLEHQQVGQGLVEDEDGVVLLSSDEDEAAAERSDSAQAEDGQYAEGSTLNKQRSDEVLLFPYSSLASDECCGQIA